MSLLLNHYCFDCVGTLLFDVTFSIPNNCNFSLSCVAKINYITIQLQPGETKPTKVFVEATVQIPADAVDQKLYVQFVQIYNGTSTKPKVQVELS